MGLPALSVPTNLCCALCGAWQSQVARLFVGVHGCVCGQCVEGCAALMRAGRRELPPGVREALQTLPAANAGEATEP